MECTVYCIVQTVISVALMVLWREQAQRVQSAAYCKLYATHIGIRQHVHCSAMVPDVDECRAH